MKKLFLTSTALALLASFAVASSVVDDKNTPFEIQCGYMRYERGSEIVFSTGDVRIKRGDTVMTSQRAEFFRKSGLLRMEDNVKIEDSTTTIICDGAEYNVNTDTGYFRNVKVERKTVSAQSSIINARSDEAFYDRRAAALKLKGNVVMRDSSTTIKCVSADYGIESSTAVLKDVKVKQGYFYLSGRDVKKEGNVYYFKNACLTTCDLAVPHYKISSPRMKLKSGDSITMSNVIFSVHGIPLFYFPYFWQKIGERKWSLSVRLGNSKRKGTYINTRFLWKWNKNFRSYLINDYFSRLGWGKGVELDYSKPAVHSNLYTYHIDERSTGVRNMTFRETHWQKLPAGFLWQSDLEFQDYSAFNGDYRRDESTELKPAYERSRLSLTKSSNAYYMRLSGYRNESWSNSLNKYQPDNVIAPQLYFRLNPRKTKYFQYDFSYNYTNYYNTDINSGALYPEYTKIHSSQARLFNSFRLSRGLTLFPRFSYIFAKTGYNPARDYYLHAINLTSNISRALQLSLVHNYEKEIGGGTVYRNVSVSDEYRPAHGVVLRQSTVYDIQKSSQILKNRFSPLQNRLDFRMGKMSFYLNNFYDIRNLEPVSWEAEASNRHFSTRFTHNRYENDTANIFQKFTFKYGKWDVSLRARLPYDYGKNKLSVDSVSEKEVLIKRNLHCWDMFFRYLVTPDRREAWVFFNVSVFPDKPVGLYHDAVDDEWSLQKK